MNTDKLFVITIFLLTAASLLSIAYYLVENVIFEEDQESTNQNNAKIPTN